MASVKKTCKNVPEQNRRETGEKQVYLILLLNLIEFSMFIELRGVAPIFINQVTRDGRVW